MDDRFDTPNRFVCRAETGTQTDLLRLFTDMPIDCTVEVQVKPNSSSLPHDRFTADGATIVVTFSQMWLRQWESPTRDWLMQFIQGHSSDRQMHCALLRLDPTDDDIFCLGIEHWYIYMCNDGRFDEAMQRNEWPERMLRTVLAPPEPCAREKPPAGLTVAEKLRWRAEQRKAREAREDGDAT